MKTRDNEEVHQAVVDGFCEGCKGVIGCDYRGDWTKCDGYCEEYDQIEKEWAEEDEEHDDSWVHDPDMGAKG